MHISRGNVGQSFHMKCNKMGEIKKRKGDVPNMYMYTYSIFTCIDHNLGIDWEIRLTQMMKNYEEKKNIVACMETFVSLQWISLEY